MVSHKQQVKIYKKLGIDKAAENSKKENNYELASLLNESSSDENADGSDGSDDEENTPHDDIDVSDLVIDLECEESTGKKLMMMEEESKTSAEMQQF